MPRGGAAPAGTPGWPAYRPVAPRRRSADLLEFFLRGEPVGLDRFETRVDVPELADRLGQFRLALSLVARRIGDECVEARLSACSVSISFSSFVMRVCSGFFNTDRRCRSSAA